MDLEGGKPRPITGENTRALGPISKDGTRFVAGRPDGKAYIFPVAGGEPRTGSRAGLAGSLIPLGLQRLGLDPAVAFALATGVAIALLALVPLGFVTGYRDALEATPNIKITRVVDMKGDPRIASATFFAAAALAFTAGSRAAGDEPVVAGHIQPTSVGGVVRARREVRDRSRR